MAAAPNGTGNLVDEFEESFMSIMQVLTKEEENFCSFEKDEVRVDIEQSTSKFLDIARQLEAFFLQKRFLLSSLKPELIVKEDIAELKNELIKKDELIKRHYEKISMWQNMLADVQGWAKSPAQGNTNVPSSCPGPSTSGSTPTAGSSSPNPAMISAMQQQIQQQQQQMQQQQQQLQQQQQANQMQQQMQHQTHAQAQQLPPMSVGGGPSSVGSPGPGMSPQHAMFMQQQSMVQRVSPFPGQSPGNMLPGPLAFLEKTTSNIGIPDGRR